MKVMKINSKLFLKADTIVIVFLEQKSKLTINFINNSFIHVYVI